jgi:hypothetical protein
MPHTPATSASCHSSSSKHVPHWYINLEFCMNALLRREDIATAIRLTNNKHATLIEILFLNHLFQTICQTERQLEQEKQWARDQISQLLLKKSSDRLCAWIINTNLGIPSRLPIGSPHSPWNLNTHSWHPFLTVRLQNVKTIMFDTLSFPELARMRRKELCILRKMITKSKLKNYLLSCYSLYTYYPCLYISETYKRILHKESGK